MSLPQREAAQRLPRREDVYAFVFVIFSRGSRGRRPFYARRRRPFYARPDKQGRGHRPFYARPDKRGSVLLRASSDSSASSFSRVSSFSRDSR